MMFLARASATSPVPGAATILLFGIVWLILAFLPATIAQRKGRSFVWFFVFSLFCWLPSLVVALLLSDQTVSGGATARYNIAPPAAAAGSRRSYQSTPPPGWYPDPRGKRERYWDGTVWTDAKR